MNLGMWLFLLVVVASCASVVFHLHERTRALRDEATLRRVDAFLTAWAIYGDWNPELKARLTAIVHQTSRDGG